MKGLWRLIWPFLLFVLAVIISTILIARVINTERARIKRADLSTLPLPALESRMKQLTISAKALKTQQAILASEHAALFKKYRQTYLLFASLDTLEAVSSEMQITARQHEITTLLADIVLAMQIEGDIYADMQTAISEIYAQISALQTEIKLRNHETKSN